MTFAALFEPIQIGRTRARNRIVSLPHGNSYGPDGVPYSGLVPYLRQVALDTAGVVIIGSTVIHETGFRQPNVSLFDDRAVPRLREMVDAVHSAESLIICQLGHFGRFASFPSTGAATWAPSSTPPGADGALLAALESDDLDLVRGAWTRSAVRVLDAGFDGLEMHSAHSFLMQQFLSPYFNRRTDAYGGSLENRMRLLVEVLLQLRALAGDRILGVRLSAGDDRPDGLQWDEVMEIAKRLDGDGLVDYVSLSVAAKPSRYVKDEAFPSGGLRERSGAIKAAVSVPVITSQRIDTPELAADILRAGHADMIGLARELVADPEWGRKARLGSTASIRPCVICMQDCRLAFPMARPLSVVGCSVNPTAYGVIPRSPQSPVRTSAAKRIVVVGGGPAGCNAALAAASAGANVVLFDRSQSLGGSARLAGRAPYRAAWRRYADYLQSEVLGATRIETLLDRQAEPTAVLQMKPDLVILATGASMLVSAQSDGPTTLSTYQLLALDEPPAWKRAAVVDPYGRWDSVNAIDTLLEAGCDVSYVTAHDRVADQVPEESRDSVLERLARASVQCFTRARLSLEGRDAVVDGPLLRKHVFEKLDGIVLAGEMRSEYESQAWALGDTPVRRIGDCLSPRGLSLACKEGWLAGSESATAPTEPDLALRSARSLRPPQRG